MVVSRCWYSGESSVHSQSHSHVYTSICLKESGFYTFQTSFMTSDSTADIISHFDYRLRKKNMQNYKPQPDHTQQEEYEVKFQL